MTFSEFKNLNNCSEPYYRQRWMGYKEIEQLMKLDYKLFLKIQDTISKSSTSPKVSHAVKYKDGTIRFIAIKTGNDDTQVTEIGSFFISEGYVSYSGGFDFHVKFPKLSSLKATSQKAKLLGWFPHNNWLCGGCAVYAYFSVPVWKFIE